MVLNQSKLGANAILGVSLASAKAAAEYLGLPVYTDIWRCKCSYIACSNDEYILTEVHTPMLQLLFRKFMIRPVGACCFSEGLRMGAEVFHSLKKVLHDRGLSTAVGDEGGFAPALNGTEDALNSIIQAIEKAGYKPGEDVSIGLDCAASEFYKDGIYDYSKFEGPKGAKRNSQEQADYIAELVSKFPIDSVEDGMSENDWAGWKILTDKLGQKVQLVGDDVFVTNVEYLSKGIKEGCANSILIKVNQIGTLTETLEAIEMAHRAGYTTVTSHRSGETEDALLLILLFATNFWFR
jgi:enolase